MPKGDNNPLHTPPAVVAGVVQAIAAAPTGKRGLAKQLAKDWGLKETTITSILAHRKPDIAALREAIAGRGLELTIGVQDRLLEKLEDDEEMKKTPVRDLALAHEKLVNSSVTAQDGHAPAAQINIGFVKEGIAALRGYDDRIKAAKARVIEPTRT